MLETLRLDGRAAVVTGAGRGLGRAMARALAKAGARVACAARTQAQIDDTVAQIEAEGGEAFARSTDVTDSAQVDALVDECAGRYGAIDIMVSNAGGGGVRGDWEFWEYPDDAFEAVLAVNLKSNFYCDRAAARHMVAQGNGGSIINVASGTAMRGNRRFAYPTAKGGTLSLSKSVATMLGPQGIRVNTIVPGFVLQKAPEGEQAEQTARQRGARIPVRRLGEWWELGPLAVYLASDASSYVTGQAFIIDGGGLAGGLGPVDFVPPEPRWPMTVEHFDLTGKGVVVAGNTPPVVDALVQAYREAGAAVTTVACPANELADRLPEAADVIACAFDHFLARPLTELSNDDVADVMMANAASAITVARHAARILPDGGRLVYVTHALGERGLPNASVYCAAHGAVHNLIRAAAQELAPRGISVNGMALGWMDWMSDRIDHTDEEAARAIRFTIAKRAGTPADVGPMAVWLSGSGAGFVTGQIFPLDGGLTQHL